MKFDAHGRYMLRAKRDPEIEEIDRARRRLWRESKKETQCHFEIVVSKTIVQSHGAAGGSVVSASDSTQSSPLPPHDTSGGSTPDFKNK